MCNLQYVFPISGHNASWYAVKGDHLEVKVIIDQAPSIASWDIGIACVFILRLLLLLFFDWEIGIVLCMVHFKCVYLKCCGLGILEWCFSVETSQLFVVTYFSKTIIQAVIL